MTTQSASAAREVRVRFAPSPTGFLHIGGVRTALFNWLYARHHHGKFLLRIEDTDLERSEDRFTQDIMASMNWLGLNWDEEPIYQAKRLDVYREKAEQLVANGHAYRCYCTEADVEKMRERLMAEGKKPMYDRTCREKNLPHREGQPYVIRAKVPLEGQTTFHDLIRGPISTPNVEIDDFVLIRSNGAPTYNLSVVVDDVYSRMTHIVRGDDHINNTPKQMHLYRFFDYPVPEFAHLPMILGPDKKKLSKRHGAVSANAYRAEGFLPETMLNFLARLGWSHGDQEIFTLQEMIDFFSFDHVQKSSAVFNSEKLLWLNGEQIRRADPARLLKILIEDFSYHFTKGVADSATDQTLGAPNAVTSLKRADTRLGLELVKLIQPKVKLLGEIAEQMVPLCTAGTVEVDASTLKWNKDAYLKTTIQSAISKMIEQLGKKIAEVPANHRTGAEGVWGNSPSLHDAGMTHVDVDAFLRQLCDQFGLKLGDFMQPVRLWVTGRMVSASLFELLVLLPWEVIDARLRKSLQ